MASRQLPPPPVQLEAGPQTPVWQRWFALLRDAVAQPSSQAITFEAVAPHNVLTDCGTLPNTTQVSTWIIQADITSVSDAANYAAMMIVVTDQATSAIRVNGNAPLLTITVAGLNLSVTQTSGGSQTVRTSIVRLL